MATGKYDSARGEFARGDIQWKPGGGTFRCFFTTPDYVPSLANHSMLEDIPESARKGTNGSGALADLPLLTVHDPANGWCDADDLVVTAIPSGVAIDHLIILEETSPTTGRLIACLGLGAGNVTNGADIDIIWDDTQRIFRL